MFFLFLLVASRLYAPLEGALQNLAAIIATKTNINRMNEILDHPVQTGNAVLTNQGCDIVFDHVGFAYRSGETVLKEVSFTARQGEVTALVGPSGGGKTTVSRLAARFWDIDKGKVVFYSLSTVTNAILQGLNHMDVPIRHAVIALVIHVAVLEVFLMVLKMGIYSVVFANIMFAFVMCLLNGHAIARFARYKQEYKRTLILPSICAGFMGAAAYGVYRAIYALLPDRLMGGRTGMAIVVFPSVAVAILVYAVLLVRFRAVEEEELKGMPGGRRLVRLLNRFRLLG